MSALLAVRGNGLDPMVNLAIALGILAILGMAALIESRRRSAEAEARETERARAIRGKYSGEDARRMQAKIIWEGETAQQLLDSLGSPAAIDEKALKTKYRAVWKYYPMGARRYGLRITLDNGRVTQWERKG